MATITRHSNTLFDIETPKGKRISVSLANGVCVVYVPSNIPNRMPTGKQFPTLAAALESYKSKEIKAALYALLEA